MNQHQSLKQILIFPGSQRRQSLNCRLAAYLGNQLQQHFDVEIITADSVDLPLFNQDLEQDAAILDQVKALHARFLSADGLLVVTPEYNGSVSPYLKNTIDWISRLPWILAEQGYSNPFYHKPLLLASATSGGSGGLLGMQTARNIFTYLGAFILPEQLSLPYAAEAWDEDGLLNNLYFIDYSTLALDQFGTLVKRMPSLIPV